MTLATVSVVQADEITVCPSGCDYTSIQAAINAASNGDIIIIGPGTFTQGLMGTGKRLTLQGSGANSTIINGTNTYNAVTILSGGVVTITDVTIQNGRSSYAGGILNDGHLTLNNTIIRDNMSTQHGGGIRNGSGATLIINNSTVQDNVASFYGGGIVNYGSAIINNSTIKNNRSTNFVGGGIMASSATLIINNSTVSGNTARWGGGLGVDPGRTVLLDNSTFSNNTGTTSNGAINNNGTVSLANTIIAGNQGSNPDCDGTLASRGYNLIQNTSGCTIVGDFTGVITGQSPSLEVLQDNGGDTQTHALLPGSPAIDAGSCSITTIDQRGFSRPVDLAAAVNVDDGCDIGSYEVGPHLKLTTTVTPSIAYLNDTITYTIIVSNHGLANATNGFASDELPAHFYFTGPIVLDPLEAGTPGNSGTLPILASNLGITAGEKITLTFPVTVNINMLLGGQIVTNVATMTSAEVTGIRGEAPITIASNPSIAIIKTSHLETATVGETITYTYRVTNTGNVSLTNLIASDTPLGAITLNKDSLTSGQATNGTLTYTIVEDDLPGPLTNTIIVTGIFHTEAITATTSISVTLLERKQICLPIILKK